MGKVKKPKYFSIVYVTLLSLLSRNFVIICVDRISAMINKRTETHNNPDQRKNKRTKTNRNTKKKILCLTKFIQTKITESMRKNN